MTLVRLDPFRELERLAEETLSVGTRPLHSMPMEAVRRGDELVVPPDLPRVGPDDLERNGSLRVGRLPAGPEFHELLIDERPHGQFVPSPLAWPVPVPRARPVAAAAATNRLHVRSRSAQ